MKPGVIVINKPEGFTSFDVIAKCRGILKERRLGHSGTLDPMATGVLPVFVGRATKAIETLPDGRKAYTARFKLGAATDTQDSSGTITGTSEKRVEAADIEAALDELKGRILQLPPMYSAVKVGGRRLYDLARQGIEVERKPREIEVFSLRLTDFDPVSGEGGLEIECSKGTYIRTLINDMGEKTGALACMTALERTYSQGFTLEKAVTLAELEAAAKEGRAEELMIPLRECFEDFAKILLPPKLERLYKNGVKLDTARVAGVSGDGIYSVFGSEFLGLARAENGEIKIYKSLWEIDNE